MKVKFYVASSWRNHMQPFVVAALKSIGHEVYDFKNPSEHALERDQGFHWSDIDPEWQTWGPEDFKAALEHPLAVSGFDSDFHAMQWADAFVLVMPCGRSAHLELGWAVGAMKPTCIYVTDGEPELMYRMVSKIASNPNDLFDWVEAITGAPIR